MWRWSSYLPFDGSAEYPLEVGGTPLVTAAALAAQVGLSNLFLKDETRGPSGSNKDRATALCVVDAKRRLIPIVSAASTGNVATSLAVGAAAVGLRAVVFVSAAGVAPQKERLMRAFGATVVKVEGTYEQAYGLCEEACRRFGWYSRNTAANPLAIEGKKTVAFEIWEQLERMPDQVFVPVGDGVTIAALERGFSELIDAGEADGMPRLVGVQAAGTAPLATAFRTGQSWKIAPAVTFADGIAVSDPFFGRQALDAVKRTGGYFVTVTDAEITGAIARLGAHGLLAEPAGAAAFAGLVQVAESIEPGSTTVVLVTGSGLKDDRWWPASTGLSVTVPPSIDAFPLDGTVAAEAKRPTIAR